MAERDTRSRQARRPATLPGPTAIELMLREAKVLEQFDALVVASSDGLPVVALSARDDAEVVAAAVALLQRAGAEACRQLGLAGLDELRLRDQSRMALVCRRLAVDGEELLLAVMVPPERSYRRVMSWAIRQIRDAWSRGRP